MDAHYEVAETTLVTYKEIKIIRLHCHWILSSLVYFRTTIKVMNSVSDYYMINLRKENLFISVD